MEFYPINKYLSDNIQQKKFSCIKYIGPRDVFICVFS